MRQSSQSPTDELLAGGFANFDKLDIPILNDWGCTQGNWKVDGACEAIPIPYPSPSPFQVKFGATAKLADAANKSLPKENARLVKQVLGGLAGLTSAACVVSAYIAAEKARNEKSLLNKVLIGAAAAGTAVAAVEIGVQTYDLFMEKEQQPELGERIKYPLRPKYN